MALKFKYKTKEEVPAEQAALYAEREGEWVLDCDGVAEKTKLDEFRSSNAALTKQVEDLKKRYEGIDPDEVRKLAEEKQRLEEERQLKAGEVEKVRRARRQRQPEMAVRSGLDHVQRAPPRPVEPKTLAQRFDRITG